MGKTGMAVQLSYKLKISTCVCNLNEFVNASKILSFCLTGTTCDAAL